MESDYDNDDAPSPDLTELAEFVERMVQVTRESGMSSVVVKTSGIEVRLKSGSTVDATVSYDPAHVVPAFVSHFEPMAAELPGHVITAPMVGTFYHALTPSDPPLVQAGDRIESGQLIGIIEAMKIMNEITADRAGTVIEVMASNATAVEYGSPLLRLGP